MRYLEYPELKMQQYLLESTLTVATKKCIFKWRTHTENLGENFRGGRREVVCPLCFSHKDDQISSLTICQPLIQEIKSIDDYQTIFSEIEKYPKLIDTITRVSKVREQKLKSVSWIMKKERKSLPPEAPSALWWLTLNLLGPEVFSALQEGRRVYIMCCEIYGVYFW